MDLFAFLRHEARPRRRLAGETGERRRTRFQRSFRLPYRPDPNQVQAQFDKGVLRVALPRPQPQQQGGGRIQIQAGSGGGQGAVQPQPVSQASAASNDAAAGGQGKSA